MTAGELAGVLVGTATLVLAAVLAVLCWSLLRAARELRHATAEFRLQARAHLAELAAISSSARDEVHRVDDLITTAESIGHTVDAASQLTYRALSNPVIKTMALAAGTQRAARRLRRSS
ncbi:MAG: hypothetical protein JJLCMIEE_00094 [Acidimicrobiales bacterium]|nr:hypothetical protein [Acidimicrobiales bacterium]